MGAYEYQGTPKISLSVGSVTVYAANGNFVGTYTTIQIGVNACPEGGTVSVAAGIYTEAVYINKGIALVGAGSNSTTITASGLGNTNTVTFEGEATHHASISGFTITGTRGRGIYCINGSPTITTNTILGNYGGIYCDNSSLSITNNTISGNSGFGIYCDNSSLSITNNTISGNNCYGIYCYSSSPSITNNTISGNGFAGIYCESSSPSITNNIITENSTTNTYYYGIYVYSGTSIINYNCVWGNGYLQPIIITSALLEQTTSLPIPNLSEQATFTLEPPPPV
ncbi:MAG: right-handed parallel beta-helix repeat-containing protein [Proteobacteria bacterium]|nr:right-handed parallel beta-helix repeat-containing protein [Pseudomonadota bacterium]MBU1599565.1 right-handed parallel beta-helix repeat-containing protein [bacterium]